MGDAEGQIRGGSGGSGVGHERRGEPAVWLWEPLPTTGNHFIRVPVASLPPPASHMFLKHETWFLSFKLSHFSFFFISKNYKDPGDILYCYAGNYRKSVVWIHTYSKGNSVFSDFINVIIHMAFCM